MASNPLGTQSDQLAALYKLLGDGDQTRWEAVRTALNAGQDFAALAAGAEVGYVEALPTVTTTGSLAIANLTLVIPAGTRPMIVHFSAMIGSSVITDSVRLDLLLDGAYGWNIPVPALKVSNVGEWTGGSGRLAASAVNRTLTMRIARPSGTGTAFAHTVRAHVLTI